MSENIRNDPVLQKVADVIRSIYDKIADDKTDAGDFFQKYVTPAVWTAFSGRDSEQYVFNAMSSGGLVRYVPRSESGESGAVLKLHADGDFDDRLWQGIEAQKELLVLKTTGVPYAMHVKQLEEKAESQ